MKYMLDTNICIYIIKKKPAKIFQIFSTLNIGDICISSITYAELQYGIFKSQHKEKNKIALINFLAPIDILNFTDKAAICYGEIRAVLEKKGQIIGAYDLLIAAHALSEGFSLVTNNIKEFSKIPGIKLLNWL
jgi:tRNA(fMet)-specific endonuclease VapC